MSCSPCGDVGKPNDHARQPVGLGAAFSWGMTAASDKMHVLAAPRRNPFADFATPEAVGTELLATIGRINASDIGQSHKTSQTDYFVAMATARVDELTPCA